MEWGSLSGAMNNIGAMFQQGGKLATGDSFNVPSQQAKIDAGNGAFAEKGSILGMTPATFASVAGQAGAALAPEGSWQKQLGSVAANFGSQKLAQLAGAEKEKRTNTLLKQVLAQSKPADLNDLASGSLLRDTLASKAGPNSLLSNYQELPK